MHSWKKRDILEKRQARKSRIAHYKAEIDLNNVLLPRLDKLSQTLSETSSSQASSPRKLFSTEVERLKTNPSPDKPPTDHEKQPTYDDMILDLLLRVYSFAKEAVEKKKGSSEDEETVWTNALVEQIKVHEDGLKERNTELEGLITKEEEDEHKKITSEDMKEGFSSGFVNKAGPSEWEKEEMEEQKKKAALTKPVTTQSIEVLNPSSSSAKPTTTASKPATGPTPDPDDQEAEAMALTQSSAAADDDDEPPELTPSAREFSKLPIKGYDQSFEFILKNPSILRERTTDALLAEAFEAQLRGQATAAKRCVHQGLMIQYCRKLGQDGVRLFFQRMRQAGPQAESVFQNDVNDTYTRMANRCEQIKKEQASAPERETIQLVAEDPSTKIGFNIPDGPPPENLIIEGLEEGQEVDMDEVKAFLQKKWDFWQGFPESLQKAMKSESLDQVNKVLEKMECAEAEDIVGKMQEGGMLSFSESGVRDMTGK